MYACVAKFALKGNMPLRFVTSFSNTMFALVLCKVNMFQQAAKYSSNINAGEPLVISAIWKILVRGRACLEIHDRPCAVI